MVLNMVTLKDIAQKVGCSESNVSRALNNHPYVKDSTREKIINTAKMMNYFPDRAARSLVGCNTGVIGVFTAGIAEMYYNSIIDGIEFAAHQADYSLMFSNFYQHSKCKQLTDRVDGLIIFGDSVEEKSWIPELMNQKIPVVILNSCLPVTKANCIWVDNKYGGYIATQHLIELGHTRIAHITGDLEYQVSLDRMEGYMKALIDAAIPVQPELIVDGNCPGGSGYQTMKILLEHEQRCTAVFVANDEMAFQALQAIYETGLSVPGDISVIAYDDLEFSRYTHPPLTTIRQPGFEMGEKSTSLLVSILKKTSIDSEGVKKCLTPELVVRGTTNRPGYTTTRPMITASTHPGGIRPPATHTPTSIIIPTPTLSLVPTPYRQVSAVPSR
jgi:LacI family transcriptional regulator